MNSYPVLLRSSGWSSISSSTAAYSRSPPMRR
jgi:hypothetical protein